MSDFDADLGALGFRRGGSRSASWSLQASKYLSYSVHLEDEGTVIVSWEVAVGELMNDRGLQIGSGDPLNIFMFPQGDTRGPADAAFVAGEMNRVETLLSTIDLTGRR